MQSRLHLTGMLGLLLAASSTAGALNTDEPVCSEDDRDAIAISRTQPDYPHSAALLCVEGTVVLRYTVGLDGGVRDARVAETQPSGLFDRAAVRATEEWQFRPACKEGGAVATEKLTAIDFVLEPASAKDCAENKPELDDAAMDLLAETGAVYGLFAEARLKSTEGDEVRFLLDHLPVPQLEEPYLTVWHFHRNALIESLDSQRDSQQTLHGMGFPHLLFMPATYQDDPDMLRTRAALDDIGQALEQHIEGVEHLRQELAAGYAELKRETGLDEDMLELLVLSFLGDFSQGAMQERYDLWRVQYAMMNAAVGLLEEHAGYWHFEHDMPRFDDAEIDTGFRRMLFQLHQSIQKSREASRAEFRSFGDYINTE